MLGIPFLLGAQQPVTRAAAIRIALGQSVRVTAISADTLAASARVRAAREYPNPSLSVSYSKDAPQQHFSIDLPLDLPPVRGARVRAAEAGRRSAHFGFLASQAALELGVDTMYTTAQGSALRARLSHETAIDAARMLSDTRARRDAGDASDLDVNLAEVSADQAANSANADSLVAIDMRLDLQSAMGLPGDTILITLADSLGNARSDIAIADLHLDTNLSVAAADAAVAAARQTLVFERRAVFGTPSLQIGADARDPTGAERGLLPTLGLALPLPLFNRNDGAIDAARADVTRAQAQLQIVRLDVSAQIASARRTRTAAESRVTRDKSILDAATRNVSLAEQAFAAGEMAIGNILETRRTQHEAQAQYVSDLVAANVAAALIRILTLSGAAQ